MTIPSFAQNAEQLETSYISGGTTKWYSHLGIFSQFLTKLNIHLIILSSNSNPRYLSKRCKNTHTHTQKKPICIGFFIGSYSIFIHNSQRNWNKLKCPATCEWMKIIMAYTGKLLITRKEHTTDTCNMDKYQRHYAKRKNRETKTIYNMYSQFLKIRYYGKGKTTGAENGLE